MNTNNGTIEEVAANHQEFPAGFKLSQNYGNPFNPTTTFLYELPEQSLVTIKVFNILGQQKATLVDGRQDAAAHSVVLDATTYASGVYYYRLTAVSNSHTFVETKKMLLIR